MVTITIMVTIAIITLAIIKINLVRIKKKIFFNYKLNTNYKSNLETVWIRVRILAEHILTEHFQYFISVNEVLAT